MKTHDAEILLEPTEYQQFHWSLICALFKTLWTPLKSKPFHDFQTCYEHHDAEYLLEPLGYQQPLILDFCIVHNLMKANGIHAFSSSWYRTPLWTNITSTIPLTIGPWFLRCSKPEEKPMASTHLHLHYAENMQQQISYQQFHVPWFLRCSKPYENQWNLNMFLLFTNAMQTNDTEHLLEPI